jgi:undecaprenyl phosphate N,N'-diacetylbacillosamine 1-phosphate transferase
MYKKFSKRLIDLIGSLTGLLLLSPLLLIVTICLFIANKGKPFFFQTRPGRNEKLFNIVKFKTMNDKKDDAGNLLSDSKRLTKVGVFIRKTSLDEIPQLINVLIGDMSLIGPRPLLLKYLPYYTADERLRHTIRPGITGWAQINGRNGVNWDKRLAYDIEYVKNMSLKLDLKILYKTIIRVINSQDILLNPELIMKNLDDERKI